MLTAPNATAHRHLREGSSLYKLSIIWPRVSQPCCVSAWFASPKPPKLIELKSWENLIPNNETHIRPWLAANVRFGVRNLIPQRTPPTAFWWIPVLQEISFRRSSDPRIILLVWVTPCCGTLRKGCIVVIIYLIWLVTHIFFTCINGYAKLMARNSSVKIKRWERRLWVNVMIYL